MTVAAMVSRLAVRRFGVVGRAELLAVGLSPSQVDRRLRAGGLVRVYDGVYRHAAVSPSRRGALAAAVLAVGPEAVVSHRSAAWLHGLRDRPAAPCEILVPGDRRIRLPGVVAHRTDTLDLLDLGTVDGIPVTTPARTLLDEGAVLPAPLVEADLEAALLQHRCRLDDLWQVLARLGRPGRGGTAVLRTLLEARAPSTPAVESALELALIHLIRDAGLPEPARQHPVPLPLGRSVRLDLAWPKLRIGIEADGRRWHTGTRFEADLARRNAITAAGWHLYHYGWAAVRLRPETVIAELGQARRQARAA
ncbi:MAG: type IV toxin-antitoxin system AbiEi family antitoxin [Acidimicrobiales bacterium]